MDPDVRALEPGRCPRCGMALAPGIPDELEYRVDLRLRPAAPRAGQKAQLAFSVRHPKTGKLVTEFEIMHEKLYHMFLISQDLEYFVHDHPQRGADNVFRSIQLFPKPGMYRILSDFYPRRGTPQLIPSTVIVPGAAIAPGATLRPDLSPKESANLEVALSLEPPQPIAGMKTIMFFDLNPSAGIEKYIGAWGHMLAASQDLIDLVHTHPFLADGGPRMQFNMIFPRPGVYRVWTQFQRNGVVNTVAFNVPVSELK
jgi:Heavy metal binding domain